MKDSRSNAVRLVSHATQGLSQGLGGGGVREVTQRGIKDSRSNAGRFSEPCYSGVFLEEGWERG